MEQGRTARVRRFLTGAVPAAAGLLLVILAGFGFFTAARLDAAAGSVERLTFLRLGAVRGLVLPVLAIGAALLMRALLERFARVHLSLLLAGLWALAGCTLVLGLGTKQLYDAANLVEAAELFARGNYKVLGLDYFHVYAYQLGLCFPMEIAARLLPGVDLNLLCQTANVFFSVGEGMALTALSGLLFPGAKTACAGLFLLFLPGLLYNVHAYGTVPMLFFVSLGLVFFAQYIRTGRARFGFLYAVLFAAAYMVKINTAVVLIAALICSVLDALKKLSVKPIFFALLAILLGVGLLQGVIWQYELRSGMELHGRSIGALARFSMGLQDGEVAAGWYNRYTEQFFPAEVTAQMQHDIAAADAAARLAQMRENPGMAAGFFKEKLLSQWLEPSYNSLWIGQVFGLYGGEAWGLESGFAGPLPGLGVIYQDGPVRHVLEALMHGMQQGFYLLTLAGMAEAIRRRDDVLQSTLPLIFLGGVLYHLLFEAKSQYAYPYVVYLMPVAAQGLCSVLNCVKKKIRKI